MKCYLESIFQKEIVSIDGSPSPFSLKQNKMQMMVLFLVDVTGNYQAVSYCWHEVG